MPQALYLLGRKLPFSADDLYLPGVIGVITRASMVVGIAVCLGYAVDSTHPLPDGLNEICPTRSAAPVEIGFLAASLVFMAIHLAQYFWMVRISTMDTILVWRRRHRRAEVLINSLTLTYFVEIALAVFGIVVMAGNPCDKNNTTWIVLLSTLVLILVDLSSAVAFAYFLYYHFSPGHHREVHWYQKRLKNMGWGFNVMTFGLFGNLASPEGFGDQAWLHFSEVVHGFLHDMMKEVVASDIIAGVLLLRAEQKRIQEATVQDLASRALSMSDPGSAPLALSERVMSSQAMSGDDGATSPSRSTVQSYLWGSPDKKYMVKLKAQMLASSTPVSPRGSWISNLVASEGRVADPARRLEAFQALEEFSNFSPYMEAIYGWKLFIYSTPLKFLASLDWLNTSWLLPKTSGHKANTLGIKRPNLRSQIEGRVFTDVTGLADHHVIYASFTAYLGESVPYTMCVDNDREVVVIAIRGTLSFADLVTDLMVTPTELEFAGRQWGFDGNGHYAHGGMFQVADRIRYDIEKQGILEKLLYPRNAESGSTLPNDHPVPVENMHDAEAFVTKKQLESTDISHYKLKIVGHSLGAGVAAILSLLLRNKYPKVTCLAYEPPGCIFSRDLAERSGEWISSIVCGVDAIPRLSWHNAKRFRAQFFEMLRRSKTNKPTVMSSLVRSIPASDLLYDLNAVPVEDVRVDLAQMIQKLTMDRDDSILDKVQMFLPGKILHLAKTETLYKGCLGGRERKFAPMWVEDRADFNEIQINQWLLFDHFPNYNGVVIRKTLKEVLEAEGRVSFGGAGLLDAVNPKLEV